MKRRAGFTLSEIIITVAIIAILATMAMPGYSRIMERQYHRQAQDLLMAIYTAEQVYFTVNDNTYLYPKTTADWGLLHMDNPNVAGGPVSYTVTPPAGGGPTFLAKAIRVGGTLNGRRLELNQNRVWGGNWTPP